MKLRWVVFVLTLVFLFHPIAKAQETSTTWIVSDGYELSYIHTTNLNLGSQKFFVQDRPIFFEFRGINFTGYNFLVENSSRPINGSVNIRILNLNFSTHDYISGSIPLVLPTVYEGASGWINQYAETLNLIGLAFNLNDSQYNVENLPEELNYYFNISFSEFLLSRSTLYWIEPYLYYFRNLLNDTQGVINSGYILMDLRYNKVSGVLEDFYLRLEGFGYNEPNSFYNQVLFEQTMVFALVIPHISGNPVDFHFNSIIALAFLPIVRLRKKLSL